MNIAFRHIQPGQEKDWVNYGDIPVNENRHMWAANLVMLAFGNTKLTSMTLTFEDQSITEYKVDNNA